MTIKTYRQIAESVGLDLDNDRVPVQKKFWYAYVNGQAVRCDTLEEAKKYKLYESVKDPVSEKDIQLHWAGRDLLKDKVAILFRIQTREQHSNMPQALFDLCYDKASHGAKATSDQEEIPFRVEELADFAMKAIRLAANDYEAEEVNEVQQVQSEEVIVEVVRVRDEDASSLFAQEHQGT